MAQPQPQQQHATASLYVGDLAHDVTEANLFELFQSVGAVISIRVCRDLITRRSLGYAYVNYTNPQDAEKAIAQFNNSLIKGRPCRVMFSQRDPSLRRSGKGNIFIKNLDKAVDSKTLYDLFSQKGAILSFKIEHDRNNESKGYGFVQFASAESAEKAVAELNNYDLKGKKIFVGPFVPRKERMNQFKDRLFTNVYIKNLADSVTDETLKTIFAKYGTITSSVVMRDNQGKSRGFGFVNFDGPEAAKKAAEGANGTEIEGKTVYVGRAQKKKEREQELKAKYDKYREELSAKSQGVNLYVKNLEDEVDDAKLREIFAPFGTITSCKVARDGKGNSKGFGFVCFSIPDEATKAVTEMNGKIIVSKPLYVALHQRFDVRRAQLETQFQQRKLIPPMYAGGPQPMFYPPMYPVRPNRGFPYQVPGGYNNMMQNRPPKGAPRGGMPQQPQQRVAPKKQGPAPTQPTSLMPVLFPEQNKLTIAYINSLPVDEQKNIMGERLYHLISKDKADLAGKITGMILESCSNEEIVNMIDSEAALKEKVDEAIRVLSEHDQN